jgi:hypothetical protein
VAKCQSASGASTGSKALFGGKIPLGGNGIARLYRANIDGTFHIPTLSFALPPKLQPERDAALGKRTPYFHGDSAVDYGKFKLS